LEKRAEQVLSESEGCCGGEGEQGERWPKECMHMKKQMNNRKRKKIIPTSLFYNIFIVSFCESLRQLYCRKNIFLALLFLIYILML
jgi:hypothetical protein